MLKVTTLVVLACVLCVSPVAVAQEAFPGLSKRIPHLTQRLRSARWEVRYSLLVELTGRDAETKRALETLARDSNEQVANQALVRYVNGFLGVDRSLFKPRLYCPGRFPTADLPEEDPERALVDYCLGRRRIESKPGMYDDTRPPIAPLDPAKSDDPPMHETLTIVGILGDTVDAKDLRPFLESDNDYVALGAAKAVIRLGDRERGVAALLKLASRDPVKHLPYVTEALQVLKELNHPDIAVLTRRVVLAVDRSEGVQPNWLDWFLLFAADVVGDEVWAKP